jgi:hypothetical protein
MTDEQARKFAAEWIENWNRRDADAVLAHFAEDAEFTSPRALVVAGKATLRSRRELGDYWHAALKGIGSIRFTLDNVINDARTGRATIVYVAEIDGRRVRAAEFFQFNGAGLVIRGEAMYGVAVG